jgi:hypothetical protein
MVRKSLAFSIDKIQPKREPQRIFKIEHRNLRLRGTRRREAATRIIESFNDELYGLAVGAAISGPGKLLRSILTRGQVDRILKLITAGLAGPHVSNAMLRQVLRPVWRNHMPTTLRALICCYFIHGRIPPLSLFIKLLKSRRQAKQSRVVRAAFC